MIKLIPENIARQYKSIPVKFEGESLYVAFVTLLNLPARDEISQISGFFGSGEVQGYSH